jgi:hypothetical protein
LLHSKNFFAWPSLAPTPAFFEDVAGQNLAVLARPKFTVVEMSDMKIVDCGVAAVIKCQGTYEGPQAGSTLKFNARLAEIRRWKQA